MERTKKQLNKLYSLNALGNISIAGAAWVLLLITQGFTIMEVAFFETVFHITSLIAEVPTGMYADVFGRKKALMMSCFCSIISAATRILFVNIPGVCVSIAFSALTYNLWSGSDSALAFDTLREAGQQDRYDRYVSTQTVIYRIFNGLATLAAGVAVMIGNMYSHLISIGIASVQIIVILTLEENKVITENADRDLGLRIRECYSESFRFLKGNRKVAGLIFRNALIGGIDVLLLFFLQAKLPKAGVSDIVLGPLLFIMSMGGIVGAALSVKVRHWPISKIFILSLATVTAGLLANFTNIAWIMTAGGFIAAFADDLIQIRADVELNNMVPPAQRATLISVSSWCFSLVMIFLSPLSGVIFSL